MALGEGEIPASCHFKRCEDSGSGQVIVFWRNGQEARVAGAELAGMRVERTEAGQIAGRTHWEPHCRSQKGL